MSASGTQTNKNVAHFSSKGLFSVQSRLRIFCNFEMATKRKVGDENRVLNPAWVRDFGFAEVHGKPMCLIFQKIIAVLKRANLQRHHEQLHPEFKAAYPPDSDLRRTKLQTLLDGFQAQQSIFRNVVKSSDNVTEASFKIAWNITKANKPATEGEFLKTTFVDCTNSLFPDFKNKDDIIKHILKLQVSDSTVIRRVEAISEITVVERH